MTHVWPLSLKSSFCGSRPWCCSKKHHSAKQKRSAERVFTCRPAWAKAAVSALYRWVKRAEVTERCPLWSSARGAEVLFRTVCYLEAQSTEEQSFKMQSHKVTLSDWGRGPVGFPPLLLCFLESLTLCLQAVLLVCGSAEAHLSPEAFLAVKCCCSRRGFFLAFFSPSSVAPLLVLRPWQSRNVTRVNQKDKQKNRMLLKWDLLQFYKSVTWGDMVFHPWLLPGNNFTVRLKDSNSGWNQTNPV